MEFLRQNLFYVVLIVLVALVGVVLTWLSMSIAGDVELREDLRTKAVSADLQAAATGQPVNTAVLDVRKKYLESLRDGTRNVSDLCTEWNRRSFSDQVLSGTSQVGAKPVPAFPVDPNHYENLTYQFSQNYLDRLAAILGRLSPTSPPTEAQIKDKKEEFLKVRPITGGPPGTTSPASAPDGGPPATLSPDDALTRATEFMKRTRAEEGLIYADLTALNKHLTKPEANIRKRDLWFAQVNLWVQSDLIDAIKAANEESLLRGGSRIIERNVMNTAVKRLVKIDVSREYFTSRSAGAKPGAGGVMNLTQRTSTRDYNVIHYDLVVVMPFRYLPLLERKLVEQNFHTFLEMDLAEATDTGSGNYYYGADPVFQVTIRGELLLLAAWERGTWDNEAKKWRYPPLMPAEVLNELKTEGVPMREDDERVLSSR